MNEVKTTSYANDTYVVEGSGSSVCFPSTSLSLELFVFTQLPLFYRKQPQRSQTRTNLRRNHPHLRWACCATCQTFPQRPTALSFFFPTPFHSVNTRLLNGKRQQGIFNGYETVSVQRRRLHELNKQIRLNTVGIFPWQNFYSENYMSHPERSE